VAKDVGFAERSFDFLAENFEPRLADQLSVQHGEI
jgi:hypothetical protein